MLALVKRNFLLYFRNRSGVIHSLFGAIIPFVLYLVFLGNNMKKAWSIGGDLVGLLDFWLIGGTLAVTALTTTLSALSQATKDRKNRVTDDLFITDLGQWGLQTSYLMSSILIGFCMQVFMFVLMTVYFMITDQIVFDWGPVWELFMLLLVNSLLSSLVNALFIHYFKSVDSLGRFATIVGTASGFLVGTYIPIGTLPNFAQFLMKLTPSSYIASLFRQVLMGNDLTNVFRGNSLAQEQFEKSMGVRLEWQELLTRQETYYIVGVIIVVVAILCFLQNMTSHRKLNVKA